MFFNQRMARLARLSPIFTFGMGQGATGSQSSAPPPFDPTSIPGLKFWLKADAGTFQNSALTTPATADGDPVGGWADQSTNSNNTTQATSSKKPTLKLSIQNGLPVVRGDGVDDRLVGVSLGVPSVVTVFVVGVATGSQGCLFAADSQLNGNMRQDTFALDSTFVVGSWTINSFALLEGQRKDGDSKAWKNGSQSGATNTASLAAVSNNAIVVFDRGGGDLYFAGDIGEIIVYAAELSTTDRQNVETYLNGRWAIY